MEIAYPTTRTRRMHARPARGVSGRVCLLVCAIADIVGRHATNCRDSPLSLSHSAAAAEGAQGKQKKQEAVMHAALIYVPAGKRAAVRVWWRACDFPRPTLCR
jgi:hypothetical protein